MSRRSTILNESPLAAPRLLELDAAAIAQTKIQISTLVAEIAELSKTCEAPAAFYVEMLSRLVTAMAGSGAGVWQRFDDGTWQLLHASTLPESLISSDQDDDDSMSDRIPSEKIVERLSTLVDNELDFNRDAKHARIDTPHHVVQSFQIDKPSPMRGPTPEHRALLECVARERQPILVPPGDIASSSDRPMNPIQQCLIFSPIPVEASLGQLWLQVVQPPSGGIATQRGYLRFVAQIADLTADFLKTHRLRQFENEQRLFAATQQLLSDAAKAGDPQSKLMILVQQLRELTGADQVILLQRTMAHRGWRIAIASGVRDLDPRSEGSQCLAKLGNWITQKWPHNRPWLANTSVEDAASIRVNSSNTRHNVEDAASFRANDTDPLNRFFVMFSAATVAWLPLIGGTSTSPNGVGCILYWSWPTNRLENARFEQLAERAHALGRLGLNAIRPPQLRHAIDHSERGSSDFVSLATQYWASRWIRTTIGAAIIAGIAFIPVPLRIVAPGTLQPRLQYRHYAPLDARITKVHVDYGETVFEGQVLLELDDRQLSNLLDDAISQQLKSRERRREIEARLLRGERLAADARFELEGELETLRALANSEQARIDALQHQIDLLTIRASEDGIIATWNAKQLLQDRPVRAGQMLLLVQQPNGPWTVDARVNQQDIGKLLKAARDHTPTAHCALTSHPNQTIPAIYQPDELPAMLAPPQDATQATSLCVRFAVPVSELPHRNAGSSARVTIDIGRGPLAWSVFGDAIVSLWAKARLWI